MSTTFYMDWLCSIRGYLIFLSCSKRSPVPPPLSQVSGSPHHSPLRGTKSAGYALGKTKSPGVDYIELAFQGDGQFKMKNESEKEMVSVKPAALKTRFDYSTVIPMSPDSEVSHDVVKAIQLKVSKSAAPPAPPRPYNIHTEANNSSASVLATPDGVGGNHYPLPTSIPQTSLPPVPVRHGITRNANSDTVLDQGAAQPKANTPLTGSTYPLGAIPIMLPRESSPPPPPVPRREHSAARVPNNGPVTHPRYACLG